MVILFSFLMLRRPPRYTRTYTLFPVTTRCLSTAITEDEAASIQPITFVDFLLHHGKAHQRMGAAHDHPTVLDSIFIIQFYVTHGHDLLAPADRKSTRLNSSH